MKTTYKKEHSFPGFKHTLIAGFVMLMFLSFQAYSQNYFMNFYTGSDTINIETVRVRNLSSGITVSVTATDVLNIISPADVRYLASTGNKFEIFPNPANESFFIQFQSPESGQLSISVYDVSGKMILNNSLYAERGFHKIMIDGAIQGLYFVQVRAESYMYSGKIAGTAGHNSDLSMELVQTIQVTENYNISEKTKSVYEIPYNFGDVLLCEATSDRGNKTVKTLVISNQDIYADGENLSMAFNFYPCKDFEQYEYPVVEISDMVWMAQNLNTEYFGNETHIKMIPGGNTWSQLSTVAYCDYNNNPAESEQYGKLYNWHAVNYSGGLCPYGWHVATDEEWLKLELFLGLSAGVADNIGWHGSFEGCYIKESGTGHWATDPDEETNSTGFTALPAGIRTLTGEFAHKTMYAAWWTATQSTEQNAWCRALRADSCDIYREDGKKVLGLSVRCVYNEITDTLLPVADLPVLTTDPVTEILMNSALSGGNISDDGGAEITARGIVWSTNPDPDIWVNEGITDEGSGIGSFISTLNGLTQNTVYYVRAYATNRAGTSYGQKEIFTTLPAFFTAGPGLTDIDGNTYSTVIINGMEFMGENLRTSRYNDGVPVLKITDAATWSAINSGAYCWYEDDSASNENLYGKLYNFNAVSNPALCPYGWHVPSDYEWKQPEMFLGMDTVAADDSGWRGTNEGGMLKEPGFSHWLSPNAAATNQSGLNVLPAGYRGADGYFQDSESAAYFWTMTSLAVTSAAWLRSVSSTETGILRSSGELTKGASVRCVRSIVTLPAVSTSPVINISVSSAETGGYISDNGWPEITSRGVVWNTTGNPAIGADDGFTDNGSGSGSFSSYITGLSPATVYYVRAYAVNSAGISYGEELVFNTLTAFFEQGPGMTDYDGKLYKTIVAGNREWMAENLSTSKYSGGNPITKAESPSDWITNQDGAYCWYNNDSVAFDSIYGKLYNYNAARNETLCPQGWMVPYDWEWQDLESLLGIDAADLQLSGWRGTIEGGKLKAPGTTYWIAPNAGATNEYGLEYLPGGLRLADGSFAETGISCNLWMFDAYDGVPYFGYSRHLRNDLGTIGRNISDTLQGFSVRCVKTPYLPTIVTLPVINISGGSAESGGKILIQGATSVYVSGLVWSEHPYPDTQINNGITNDGQVEGEFNSIMTGLVPGTVYYVRAYATNADGTAYGNQIEFTAE